MALPEGRPCGGVDVRLCLAVAEGIAAELGLAAAALPGIVAELGLAEVGLLVPLGERPPGSLVVYVPIPGTGGTSLA